MRSTILALLLFLTASYFHALTPAQSTGRCGGVRSQTSPPEDECFEFHLVRIEGVENRWARMRVGDKWITGCLGDSAPCYAPVWIRC
jgi:hypothetical protein